MAAWIGVGTVDPKKQEKGTSCVMQPRLKHTEEQTANPSFLRNN